MKFKKLKFIIAVVLINFFVLSSVQASTLLLTPAEGEFGAGDSFAVEVKIKTDTNECINVVEATIDFPKDILAVKDFSTGNSLLSLWIKNPTAKDISGINNSGQLTFAGGVPGGYCGKIPGDPGDSNILGKIIFDVIAPGITEGSFKIASVNLSPENTVLLNDGLGTEAKLMQENANFKIVSTRQKQGNDWEEELKQDKTMPESFVIEVNRDPKIFENKYFAIFSTMDKQTGIDHYEILEIRPGEYAQENISFVDIINLLFGRTNKLPAVWKTASSPYLLNDQALTSIIKIKAVDKAGNERTIEYFPPEMEQKMYIAAQKTVKLTIIAWSIIIILLLLIIALAYYLIRRFKHIRPDNKK